MALIGAFLPAERPTGRQWAGILLSFAGIVALVLAAGDAGGGSLMGNLLVLAASLSAAVYSILARRLLVSRSALFVTTWQNLFGALFMAPLALVEALVLGVRRPTAEAAGGCSSSRSSARSSRSYCSTTRSATSPPDGRACSST